MKVGNRTIKQLYWVLSRKENYLALINFFKVYKNPLGQILNEFFSNQKYPYLVSLKSDKTNLLFNVGNAEERATIHAIFCREDYKIGNNRNIVIDIGSNRGFTIGYFLSKNEHNFVYGFEPDKNNFRILQENLSQFAGKYSVKDCAVSDETGVLNFFSENTGKYGSLESSALGTGNISSYSVNVLGINDILKNVFSKHDRINLIKIDTEGHERKIINSIEPQYWSKIDCIYSENTNCSDIIPSNFKRTWRYDIEKIEPIKN